MGQLCARRKQQEKNSEKEQLGQEESAEQKEKQELLKNTPLSDSSIAASASNYTPSTSKNKPPNTLRIALVGAAGVGKSSIFKQIEFNKKAEIKLSDSLVQEIGEYTVDDMNIEIFCWTISEEDQDISMNTDILEGFDAVAFVFDKTADLEKTKQDGLLLRQFISFRSMLSLPLLIFLNKSDIPTQGINVWELSEKAGLQYIQGREIHIQTSSGVLGNGIQAGLIRVILFIKLLREKSEKELKNEKN